MGLSKNEDEKLNEIFSNLPPEVLKKLRDMVFGVDPATLIWSDAKEKIIAEMGILPDNGEASALVNHEDTDKIKELAYGMALKQERYFELCNAKDKEKKVRTDLADIKKTITCLEPEIMSKKFYTFCESHNIDEKREQARDMLELVTNADIIKVNVRGEYINARELKIIEYVMGLSFCGSKGKNPTDEEAVVLHEIYCEIENYYYTILNMHAELGGLLIVEHEYEKDGKLVPDLSDVYDGLDKRIRDYNDEREIPECLVYDLGVYLLCYDMLHKTDYFGGYEKHYSDLSESCAAVVKRAGERHSERKLPKDIKKKMMGLGTAFKKVYEEELGKHGFKKGESKYPYFFRVIGDEIIHVITYQQMSSGEYEHKKFDIFAGVFTVYNPGLTFDKSPSYNRPIATTNFKIKKKLPDGSVTRGSFDYSYRTNNEEDMIRALKESLEETKEYLIYELDKVTNLKACIDFIHKSSLLIGYYDDDYGIGRYDGARQSEWLLFFKLYTVEEYTELEKSWWKEDDERREAGIKAGLFVYSEEKLKKRNIERKERFDRDIENFTRWANDPVRMKKIMDELERRKLVNKEYMKKMGIEI